MVFHLKNARAYFIQKIAIVANYQHRAGIRLQIPLQPLHGDVYKRQAYYHCLLFDLDGTLLDFGAAEDAAIRETLAYYGFERPQEAVEAYKQDVYKRQASYYTNRCSMGSMCPLPTK